MIFEYYISADNEFLNNFASKDKKENKIQQSLNIYDNEISDKTSQISNLWQLIYILIPKSDSTEFELG